MNTSNTENHRSGVDRLAITMLAVITLGANASVAGDLPKDLAEAWVAPARAARKENPIPADAKSIAQGKEFFTAACFACHGPAGKGDGPAAVSLERNGVRVRP